MGHGHENFKLIFPNVFWLRTSNCYDEFSCFSFARLNNAFYSEMVINLMQWWLADDSSPQAEIPIVKILSLFPGILCFIQLALVLFLFLLSPCYSSSWRAGEEDWCWRRNIKLNFRLQEVNGGRRGKEKSGNYQKSSSMLCKRENNHKPLKDWTTKS